VTPPRGLPPLKAPCLAGGLLDETSGDTVRISGYDLKTGITTTIPADVRDEGKVVLSARLFAISSGSCRKASYPCLLTTVS
jgi:DNA polymerase III sliding clamp (beta) subunit (PCNA family)